MLVGYVAEGVSALEAKIWVSSAYKQGVVLYILSNLVSHLYK